jgi:hypothetical protein
MLLALARKTKSTGKMLRALARKIKSIGKMLRAFARRTKPAGYLNTGFGKTGSERQNRTVCLKGFFITGHLIFYTLLNNKK